MRYEVGIFDPALTAQSPVEGRAVSHNGPTKFCKGFASAPRGVLDLTVNTAARFPY